ncbi:MAG: low affinity iron permease family protein [Patescibacteria group bacterium]
MIETLFRKFAHRCSEAVGSSWAFAIAFLVVLMWATTGPFFGYSDTWQLIINTATTISTGLIVFLVQNTQNRDGKAIQIKLDELLRAGKNARTSFVDIEEMSDKELDALQDDFRRIHQQYSHQLLRTLHTHVDQEKIRRQGSGHNHR